MAYQQLTRITKTVRLRFACFAAASVCAVIVIGCGTTVKRAGTEQLLISNAVDNAVEKLDFHELNGHKVFFDTDFLKSIRSDNFVSKDYVISAIRHQLVANGALVQDSRESADTIVEARVGALGTDDHEITYGIPKTGGLTAAASVLSNSPLGVLPEISFAQTNSHAAVAKVIVFAYDQKTREPIWQSGVAKAESNSSHTWVLGAGPFQKGSIYEGSRFAGKMIGPKNGFLGKETLADENDRGKGTDHPLTYRDAFTFQQPTAQNEASIVKQASAEEDITDDQEGSSEKTTR